MADIIVALPVEGDVLAEGSERPGGGAEETPVRKSGGKKAPATTGRGKSKKTPPKKPAVKPKKPAVKPKKPAVKPKAAAPAATRRNVKKPTK